MAQHSFRASKGFTIVELIIVIVVIAILAALGVVGYGNVQSNARDKTILSDIDAVETDIVRYAVKNSGTYGSSIQWYSLGSSNPNIDFTPSSGNVIDVVADSTRYCIRGYNTAATKNSITNAATKESSNGACSVLSASVAAGGTGSVSDLKGWWKFNGNANDSSGNSFDLTSTGPTLTMGQNGQANTAYAFNGTVGNGMSLSSTMGLGNSSVTIACWVYNPTTNNKGIFVKLGPGTVTYGDGYGIGMGSTDANNSGNKLVFIFEYIRWIPTTAVIPTGWHHVAMVIDGSGIPTAYLDGVSAGSYPGSVARAPTAPNWFGAQTAGAEQRNFNGSIDDIRVYGKALTGGEITALYTAGAE